MSKARLTYHIILTVAFVVFLNVAGIAEGATLAITQEALLTKLQSNAVPIILDVRTPGEYRSGHVPKAINIPYTELGKRSKEIADARDREVVVYCELGGRAGIAESILQQAGFTAVRHLVGDMAAWRSNRLPIERP